MNEVRTRRTVDDSGPRLWIATCTVAFAAVALAWVTVLGATGDPLNPAVDEAATATTVPGPTTTSVAPTTSTTVEVEAVTAVDASGAAASDTAPDFTDLRIEVVGDSLAASTIDELRSRFDGAAIGADTEPGRSLRGSLSALTAAGAAAPDIAVVVLGTNDWNGPDDYPEQLDGAAVRLDGAQCVVWVDTQEFRDGLVSVNEDIAAAAVRHDWLVARWSALAGPSELHTSDGYHLSPAGQELLADLVVATAAGCLA